MASRSWPKRAIPSRWSPTCPEHTGNREAGWQWAPRDSEDAAVNLKRLALALFVVGVDRRDHVFP
jgi:hypothetical protein